MCVAKHLTAHAGAQSGVQRVEAARPDDQKVEVPTAQSELVSGTPIEDHTLGADGEARDDGCELFVGLTSEIVVEVEVARPTRRDRRHREGLLGKHRDHAEFSSEGVNRRDRSNQRGP